MIQICIQLWREFIREENIKLDFIIFFTLYLLFFHLKFFSLLWTSQMHKTSFLCVPFWSNMDSGFPHRLVYSRADILFTLFVLCLRIVVSNTYRVVVSVTWWNLALSNHLNWYFVPSEVFFIQHNHWRPFLEN